MSVSFERFKSTYLPIFHKGEIPIVRLEEETDSEQGEEQSEERASRKKRVLEWISNLVLTESQRDKAENVIPIVIPIFAVLSAHIFYEVATNYHIRTHIDNTSASDYILSDSLFFILTLIAILLIGIPLEVAHGKLKIFCLIAVMVIHNHLLNYDHYHGYFEFDERVVNIALVSAHLTNIAMNWHEMEYKVHRFILLLILLGPGHLLTWIYFSYEHGLQHPINILYSISSTNGIIFGYYWFYGNKKSTLKYALIIVTLIVIVINRGYIGYYIY